MGPTPIQRQPSRYVRTVWAGKPTGAVRSINVQAAHNGQDLLLRLEWPDATGNVDYGDGSIFPDAAGVLFPVSGDAPLLTMGSAEAPVNAWFWRASLPDGQAQNIIAQGLGTVEQLDDGRIRARARRDAGSWTLVLARPLAADNGKDVTLEVGSTVKIAFAVWEGSHQERGGIKSFSKRWVDLSIEAGPAGKGG